MNRCWTTAVSIFAISILGACGGGTAGNAGGGAGGGGGNGAGGGSLAATHFNVTVPPAATPGTFFAVTVQALDTSNNPAANYSGTVHFTSSDAQASLPTDTTLTDGAGTFSASLASLGNQSITATDTIASKITGTSSTIDVAANAAIHGFQADGNLLTERADHTATLLPSGKILITGGYNSTEVLSSAELFDPATGTSTATGSMNAARFSHTATLLPNGQVLITGGSFGLASLSSHKVRRVAPSGQAERRAGNGSTDFGDLATAELYDPSTGAFTLTGSMSEVRTEHTATLLPGGKVLVEGGSVDNVAELYDPTTGAFTPTTGLMVAEGWGSTATLLSDGTVLIAGGRDDENVFDAFPMNSSERFDPTSEIFTATGNMTEFRYAHTATLLANGQVLLAGGINGRALADAELYNPATQSYAATATSMNSARDQYTATLLTNGQVLLAGGLSAGSPPPNGATADLFDPATGSFTATGIMGIGRAAHTATLLNNGDVIVVAGQVGGLEDCTTSVEVYR